MENEKWKMKAKFSLFHFPFDTAFLAGLPGFEPGNAGVKVRCLTAWRQPKMPVTGAKSAHGILQIKMALGKFKKERKRLAGKAIGYSD